ncbi:spermatogenesis-associated protein 31D1-like [Rhinolophus ferrumequinum]|uniref:spermatogenesis-associated protein 31D1-like n=1 Tax=Rhinolophus ferrumequinum TaxID=59479 RepID=UPI00140FFA60|nr:spermatogenesis-associated protein 31D1-like [Rhinolophus ferrumequinum]
MGVGQWEGQQASGGPTPQGTRSSFLCSGPGCSFVPPVSCSPLGQHYDTKCFRRMLCPDPFCDVCNHATAEINSLLFPEALEDATPSVSPLASTASVTESSFPLSPAVSALPPGHPIPAPLPEPSSSPSPILSTNAMTPLPNPPSLLSPGHSLPPKLFRPLESKFPAEHSQGQPPGTPSCGISRTDLLQLEASLTLNTIFLDPSLSHRIDPLPDLSQKSIPTNSSAYDHEAAVLSTSPSPDTNFTLTQSEQPKSDNHVNSSTTMLESAADKHDSVIALPFLNSRGKTTDLHVHQQPSHPEAWEASLLENRIYLFWGFPSLHSESLSSAIHVLGDYSSIFIFNRISNASTCQEYPILFHPLPPSLPEVQPQPVAQTLPQAPLLSPLPTPPSDPLPQRSRSGVHLHRPRNESDTMTTSEMQHLEWHVLRKQQERLWGLPPVVQRSQEAFYSSAPQCARRRPSQAPVSVSILLGDIPLSNELRKTLDHHLRKRLIQHRWGLPHRIHESLSLMRPLSHCADTSESKSNYGLSWICAYKGQSSKNHAVGLSPPSSSSDSSSEEDELKGEGDRPENGQKDDVSRDAESSSPKDPGYDSEEDLDSLMMGLSGGSPMVSRQNLRQGQVENILKVHSGTKFEDINAGRLPAPVHSACPAMKQIPTLSVNAHIETKRSAPPSVGGDCCLNTCQELSFLECSAQESLDSHMKNFCLRMRYGLPSKVLESLEIIKLRDTSLYSNLTSSMNLSSEVSSKSGSFMSLRRSTTSLHGDDVTTAHSHSTSILARPLPATSYVGQEGRGDLSQSRSDIHRGLTGDIQRMREARQTLLPGTQNITGQESPKQTLLINTASPKLPAMRPVARHERKDESVITTDRSERQKGKKMENQSEPVSVPVTRVLFRAKELKGLQSNTSDILVTTSKPGISQGIPVNENKRETTVTPESPPAKMLFLQNAKSPDSRAHLPGELQSEPENRERSQADGPYSDMPVASDGLTYTASRAHAQGVSSVDMGAPQVLHVHVEDRGVCMQQRQEPWLPEHILRCGQDKNFPQTKRRGSHQGPKSEALGGGDTGLETSRPGRKSVPPQEVALEEVLGSKSSQTLAQEGLSSLERLLRIKLKHFFRWIRPGVKCEQQENSQEKGSPLSSAGSRGPDKSTRAFTGVTKGLKVMTGMGKFLQEKLGHRSAADMPCTQERLLSPVKFGQAQQKAQVRAQAGLIRGHPFNSRPPCCKVTKSCQQAFGFAGQSSTRLRHTQDRDRQPHQKAGALKEQLLYQKRFQSGPCRETVPHPSPGQSSTSLRQTRDKGRQPQKATAFKEQRSCEKHPQSTPHREAVPHSSHTYRHHGGQGRGAALSHAEGMASEMSLYY